MNPFSVVDIILLVCVVFAGLSLGLILGLWWTNRSKG